MLGENLLDCKTACPLFEQPSFYVCFWPSIIIINRYINFNILISMSTYLYIPIYAFLHAHLCTHVCMYVSIYIYIWLSFYSSIHLFYFLRSFLRRCVLRNKMLWLPDRISPVSCFQFVTWMRKNRSPETEDTFTALARVGNEPVHLRDSIFLPLMAMATEVWTE